MRSDRPGAATAECYLVPIDACYELVGQLRRLWRGFDGGQEAHDALDAFFDGVRATAQRSGRGSPAVSSLVVRGARRRAEPHAAVPTLALRLRLTEADAQPVHAVALRCQIMIEPQRRRYEPRGAGPPGRAVRRDAAVGRDAAAVPVDARRHDRHRLHGDDRGRPPDHVHVRLRGRGGQVPARRSTTARSRSLLLFSGTVFRAPAAGGFAAAPVAWHEEASYRLPGRGLARRDGPVLPQQRLAAGLAATRSTRSPGSRPGGPCRRGTRPSSSC